MCLQSERGKDRRTGSSTVGEAARTSDVRGRLTTDQCLILRILRGVCDYTP